MDDVPKIHTLTQYSLPAHLETTVTIHPVTGRRIGPCEQRALIYDPQKAALMEEIVIKDVEELRERLKGKDAAVVSMDGWVFQAVDFSEVSLSEWDNWKISGADFLGCTFPQGVTAEGVRRRGGTVWENHPRVPFTALRSYMYRQEELKERDHTIYSYYLKQRSLDKTLAEAMHDHSMMNALSRYLEGKIPVGVMGGHRLSRKSKEYHQLVWFCRNLVQNGFLVVTGGGPGAMEAANLGAYLANKTDDQVRRAIEIISTGNEAYEGVEYLNHEPADNVIKQFGLPDSMPSVGIPTYRYGHEPSNKFATYHAKFFSNAIREDGLLSISVGGIIYVTGGAGTIQEIFQAACHNTYCKPHETRPLVLIGKDFWNKNQVWPTLTINAKGTEFSKYLLLTDSYNKALRHLIHHANCKCFHRSFLEKPFTRKHNEQEHNT